MSGRNAPSAGEEVWQAVVLQTQGSCVTVITNWGTTAVAGFQDGALKGTLVGHQRPITALGVDNVRLISAAQDGALRVWATDGQCLRVIPFGDAPITALVMMPPRLYTAHDREVRASSAGSYAQLGWLRGHESDVTCLTAWHTKLISGSIDATVRVWKLPVGECERVLRGHTDVVTCVVGWGNAIASSSWDRTVRIWSTEEKSERVLGGHKGKVLCLALHPTLDVLFSGAADRTIRAWTLSGECVKVFEGWFSAAISCLLIFEGQTLFAGAQDGAVGGWRLPQAQVVHNTAVTYVRPRGASPFSPNQDPIPPPSPRSNSSGSSADQKHAPPPASPGRDTLKSSRGSAISDKLRSFAANVTGKSEKHAAPKQKQPSATPTMLFSMFAEFVRRGDAIGLRDSLTETGASLTNTTDESGQTLLHLAAAEGRLPIVRMLLSRNIVNATDRSGWTPLLCAATGSHLAVCRLLLENQASASACTSTGSNALHLLCRSAVSSAADKQELLEVMGMLASRGADVNQRNIHGVTPLHEAAAWGRAEVAYLLLDAGAEPMAVSKLGETPIQVAMRKSLKDVVVVIRSRLTAEQRAALPDEAQRSPGSTLINGSPVAGASSSGSNIGASPLAAAAASNSPSNALNLPSPSLPPPLTSAAAGSLVLPYSVSSVPPAAAAPSTSPSLPVLRLPKSPSAAGEWKSAVRRADDDKSPGASPTASPRGIEPTTLSPRPGSLESISPRSRAAPPDFAYALMPPLDAPPETRSSVFTTAIAASASLHLTSPRGPGAMRVSYNGVAYRLPDGAPQPARLVIFTRRAALLISTSGAMLPDPAAPRLAAEHRSRLSVMPASPDYTQLSIAVERLQVRNDIAPGAVEIFDARAPDQGKFLFKPADNQRVGDLSAVLAERSAAHRVELLFARGLVALHDGFLVFLRNLQTKAAEFTTPPTLLRTMQGIVNELEVLAARLAEVDAEHGLRVLDERLSQHQRLVELFCEFYTTFPAWLRAYLPDELGDIPLRYCLELAEHVRQPEAVRYPASASLLSQLAVLEEQLRKLSRSTEPIRASRRNTIVRPQFAYVVAQRAISVPERNLTVQRGERGIMINDADATSWRVSFTVNGTNVEVSVPPSSLFRVTKEISKDSAAP